jgi:O-antigen/teichoic acid export membrane protein
VTAEVETEVAPVSTLAASELKKLALHSSHYLAGLAGNLAIGLIAFPVFTRLFSVSEYGLFDLAQRIVLMLAILSKLGMQNAVLRFYDAKAFAADDRAARSYYSTMYLGTLGTSLAVGAAFLGVSRIGAFGLLSGGLEGLVYLIAALVFLRAAGAILWGFLRIEERTKAFNATTVGTRAVTVLAIFALLALIGPTATAYFGGTVLVEAILISALTLWMMRRRLLAAGCFDFALFRSGVVYGLPLVVYELAFAILASADRVLVRHYLGGDALGYYSVAYGLAQHTNELLVGPLILAILPIYMRMWNSSGPQKTAEFLTIALDLFVLAAIGVLAVMVATARPLVLLLASSKYAGVDHLIPVILAGLFVYATYVFVAAGLLIEKKTLRMAGLLLVAAAVNIALNCLLLPRMGLDASALATLLSYALCILLLGRASHRYLRLRFKLTLLAKYLLAGLAASMIAMQIRMGTPALEVAARSAVAVSVYVAALYSMDGRVRRAARRAFVELRARV